MTETMQSPATNAIPKIEVVGGSFSYNRKATIWDGINLQVNEGECVCLLGANGCGKTTLLHCMCGAHPITGGQVLVNGRNIQEYSITELAQTVGIVYQDHTVSFPYTSLEVVRMGRAPYLGMFETPSQEDTALAYEVMKELGIEDIAGTSYNKISGGQRQLVLIARTLCQQPQVILFDEPTSHLDFKNQAIVMKTLQRLSEKGMTIVMTSHFPSHAWQVGTKVVLMGNKGIIAQGTPEEIMTEDNLSDMYGVRVRIVNKQTEGSKAFFCEPRFD